MKEEYYKFDNNLYHVRYFNEKLSPYITGYHSDIGAWSNCILDMPIDVEVDFLKRYGFELNKEDLEKEIKKLKMMSSLYK